MDARRWIDAVGNAMRSTTALSREGDARNPLTSIRWVQWFNAIALLRSYSECHVTF